jgi:hypothetical protein
MREIVAIRLLKPERDRLCDKYLQIDAISIRRSHINHGLVVAPEPRPALRVHRHKPIFAERRIQPNQPIVLRIPIEKRIE